MLKISKTLIIFTLLSGFFSSLYAEVEILPYKKFSWQKSWSQDLYMQLSEDRYSSFLKRTINEEDLAELNCREYNDQTDMEKRRDFWIVFLSALTRAESAFNPRAAAIAPKGGHGNYGLLQFSKRTAREKCSLNTLEAIYDPKLHLSCGMKLLEWQIAGAPTARGRLRADLENHLFGKRIFLWGPLRKFDRRGRALLVGWFKKHLTQLPYCNQKN